MGRNRQRNEEIRCSMMEEIEAKALEYFARYGYYGTKMSDLSKGIHISVGLIYHYYSSKEELLQQILKKILENRDKELAPLKEANLSAKKKIEGLTASMKELILESNRLPATFTLMEKMNFFEEHQKDFQSWANPSIEILAGIIQNGQREGSCYAGDCISLSVSYWGLVSAICRDRLAVGRELRYSFEALNQMLIKGEER